MALYNYNNTILPEMPAVDSDYPYAAILKRDMDYYLYLTDKKGQYKSDTNEWVFLAGTSLKAHELGSGMWMLEDTMTLSSDTSLPTSVFTGIWANYDIVHTSDSSQVKFAGSEAELYFPKIYRYGDVLLPEVLNGYPIEGYNHTVIIAYPGDYGIEYALVATTTQCYAATTGSGSVILSESDLEAIALFARFNAQTGSWAWFAETPLHEAGIDISTKDILWTSTDILNGSADSTEVYFAASEPPVYDLKYYYYNDVFASELPFRYSNEYPYAYILNIPQSNAADTAMLILSKSTFYIMASGDTRKSFVSVDSAAESIAYFLGSEINLWNTYIAGKASQFHCDVVVPEDYTKFPAALLWANIDVPDGSADSSTLYLAGSEPVEYNVNPEPDEPDDPSTDVKYSILGSTLKSLGDQTRRLANITDGLTPLEMVEKLSKVQGGEYSNLLIVEEEKF